MKRRDFIRNGVLTGLGTSLVLPYITSCKNENEAVKPHFEDETANYNDIIRIGICTDVHQDYFYGMPERLQVFVDDMKERNADFVIQLGDFCYPIAENIPFLNVWNSFEGPKYHVMGNHDMDHHTKEDFMRFTGMPKPYYSFDIGGYHFIVLDLNNAKVGSTIVPYSRGNQNGTLTDLNYMDNLQLQWLEEDINATNKRTIIFSHQTLFYELQNKAYFDGIIEKANAKHKKVIATFSGHQHLNWMRSRMGVQHIQVNSMSYNWPGNNDYLNETRYPQEVYDKYPVMKRMWPYGSSLYAYVELDPTKGTLTLTGTDSFWVAPSPEEMGAAPRVERVPIVEDRFFSYL